MNFVELALILACLVALIVGYRRNHRNMLVAAALVLFLAGTIGDFSSGLIDGYAGVSNTVQTHQAK